MDKVTMLKRLLKPVLLVTISIILIAFNYTLLGIILLIFYGIDNFYTLNIYWNKEDDIYYFSKTLDKGIEDNVLQFLYPLTLIKENGEIIWCNKLFNTMQSGDSALGNNILSIASGLNLTETLSNENNHQRLNINDKLYDVYTTVIEREDDEYIYLLSFNDITKLIDYEKTQEGIMLIEVDNLSEVLGKTEENNRPLLAAEVERTINCYANNLKAMIEKYDTNKYVLSLQDRYIENEINKQFNIIDEISKINLGNSIEVTLSIGIGCGGISPQENYNSAKFAKELALGRGGDQAVVKDGNDIKFFGGNTKEVEKRTKVKARVIARALRELICESSNVYILGHKNPDMDCLGAAMGLASVIKQLGKKCNIVLNNDNNAIEYYLNKLKDDSQYDELFTSVEYATENIDKKTLMIIVDVHNKGYISDLQLANKAERKVIIDHHRRSPDMIENDI
ncbi:MAG: DHH family phosphoesterase, partial [Bacilli bacterium]